MILATNVYYNDENHTALAAGVTFFAWGVQKPTSEHVTLFSDVAPYEPGAFYKRELPCILAVIRGIGVLPDVVVIDGYVDLAPDHPGLGRHLYEALDQRVAVIGVAKTRFVGATAVEVTRGGSVAPLFVTASGVDVDVAAGHVRGMHGSYRIPTLLHYVDALSRGRRP